MQLNETVKLILVCGDFRAKLLKTIRFFRSSRCNVYDEDDIGENFIRYI